MTRILVQRGNSSSNSSRSSVSGSSSSSSASSSTSQQSPLPLPHVLPIIKEGENPTRVQDELPLENTVCEDVKKCGNTSQENSCSDNMEISCDEVDVCEKDGSDEGLDRSRVSDRSSIEDDRPSGYQFPAGSVHLQPPPPPMPPQRSQPTANLIPTRLNSGSSNVIRSGTTRKMTPRPASPRHHSETDGYNSADEQSHSFASSYDDSEKERQFEMEIRRAKGFEVKRMLEDGNCLFRAVADQVYGDSEFHDLTRQMCIDYMERERDHFSQFITEGFISYCKRKRRDKVYGNNVEIQAMSEMYNRPIHIYSYGTDPINIFHGSYNTDSPPLRLSYHHGNHYNSLVDPHRLSVGVGLGFSSLRGRNVDKEQVKAALKAQQDQQIDNVLLAEGRFYSDLELTEKEMEQMVMEESRVEYHIASGRQRRQPQAVNRGTSTSGVGTAEAEPSSSGAGMGGAGESDTVQAVLSMGFAYVRVVEAYSIFGDDVNSIVCYLVEMSSSGGGGNNNSSSSKDGSSRKGKAATE